MTFARRSSQLAAGAASLWHGALPDRADAAHLLGATIWVGGHVVLASIVLPQALNARDAALLLGFESRFERVGMPALLAATFALALNARFRIIPKLDAARLPLLALHIHAVLALGVGFVIVGMLLRTGG